MPKVNCQLEPPGYSVHSNRSSLQSVKGFSSEFAGSPLSGLKKRWRIALYSHDTMGLGHKRRNLLIAQTIGASGLDADILMISGMQDASDAAMPEGVDYLTLPALYKREDGQYQARRMGLDLSEMIGLRSRLIRSAIKGFQPNLVIVDNVPRGAVRELDPTLEYIRSQPHIRCVLGLRDVLDTPAVVRRDWQRADNEAAIRRYYDAVWVYGDPTLYDLREAYGFSADITAKMRPLGYLDPRARLRHVNSNVQARLEALNLPVDNLVLCLVGGGQDGAALASAFARAKFPAGMTGVLLTGPFMPRDRLQLLQRWAARYPQLRVVEYLEEPTLLLERASRVIAMGGYNTTCEVLAFQKPALLVPRVSPRQEQWIRAERLQQMGLVDLMHPYLVRPEALTAWLHRPVVVEKSYPAINLKGLDHLLVELRRLLLGLPMEESRAS